MTFLELYVYSLSLNHNYLATTTGRMEGMVSPMFPSKSNFPLNVIVVFGGGIILVSLCQALYRVLYLSTCLI